MDFETTNSWHSGLVGDNPALGPLYTLHIEQDVPNPPEKTDDGTPWKPFTNLGSKNLAKLYPQEVYEPAEFMPATWTNLVPGAISQGQIKPKDDAVPWGVVKGDGTWLFTPDSNTVGSLRIEYDSQDMEVTFSVGDSFTTTEDVDSLGNVYLLGEYAHSDPNRVIPLYVGPKSSVMKERQDVEVSESIENTEDSSTEDYKNMAIDYGLLAVSGLFAAAVLYNIGKQ